MADVLSASEAGLPDHDLLLLGHVLGSGGHAAQDADDAMHSLLIGRVFVGETGPAYFDPLLVGELLGSDVQKPQDVSYTLHGPFVQFTGAALAFKALAPNQRPLLIGQFLRTAGQVTQNVGDAFYSFLVGAVLAARAALASEAGLSEHDLFFLRQILGAVGQIA